MTNVESFQATPPLFDFILPESNIAGVEGGGPGQGVGSGVSLILEPLSPGLHIIHFRASTPELNFFADVTYQITVYARPSISGKWPAQSNIVELSWRDAPGFTLEEATQLAPTALWSPSSPVSSKIVDEMRIVEVTNAPPARFFRLVGCTMPPRSR